MKLKSINIFLLSIITAFGIIFGVYNYSTNKQIASVDSLFESQNLARINDLTKSIAEDINTTNTNKAKNNQSTTSNSPVAGNPEVNFTNFYQMYEFAVKKFNKANYVLSTGNGTALLSGSVPSLGVTIKDKTLSLGFTKAKQQNEKYFSFSIKGRLVEGFKDANIATTHYTNGTIYEYNLTGKPVIQLTESDYISKMDWNMTQIFHLPTENVSKNVKDSEIIAFYFDESKKEYVANLSFDVSTFNSNFSKIAATITNASAPAKFTSIEMIIRVDNAGNFKSISYSENFSATINYEGLQVSGSVKTNYTESFVTIDNGFVQVTKPF